MRGLFITFEGTEGSGKSTQVRLLETALKQMDIPSLRTREPGGPPISEAIRTILLNPDFTQMQAETELLLYMASRAQHTAEWIIPALQEGKIVLCDRYNDSTIAYQGAARDLDQDFIAALAGFATRSVVPDITFLVDLPVEVGMARIKDRKLDRMENEHISFHRKVRDQYLRLASTQAFRYIVLDGTLDQQEIHQLILNQVLSRFRSIK